MKKLEIKVDSPCSENWNDFEKRGPNGFCRSCQKVVVDFTKMSEREIKNYFLEIKDQEICGRMRKNQQKQYTLNSQSRFRNYFSSVMATFAILFTSIPSVAQKSDEIEVVDKTSKKSEIDKSRIVSGIVTDDTGEPLPGVNVIIKGTVNGTQTDLDGHYKIKLSNESNLIFAFVGFETQEIEVGSRSIIDLSMGGATELGEIVITGGISSRWYSPRGLWWRIKSIF